MDGPAAPAQETLKAKRTEIHVLHQVTNQGHRFRCSEAWLPYLHAGLQVPMAEGVSQLLCDLSGLLSSTVELQLSVEPSPICSLVYHGALGSSTLDFLFNRLCIWEDPGRKHGREDGCLRTWPSVLCSAGFMVSIWLIKFLAS